MTFESNVDSAGTDRVYLNWADNAIENEWLQITVNAGSATGLAAEDVFYFGNVIGETGNDPTNALVSLEDVAGVRINQTGFGTADIENDFDFDRDGRVDLVDLGIARVNQSGFSQVDLITPGSGFRNGFASGADGSTGKGQGGSLSDGQLGDGQIGNLLFGFGETTGLGVANGEIESTKQLVGQSTSQVKTNIANRNEDALQLLGNQALEPASFLQDSLSSESLVDRSTETKTRISSLDEVFQEIEL